ncbi:MAG: SDR family NAD(P)-dependent oxidoreductase [Hymenobacteraceae bacterium]|nr:SDR family NAD(P)-dependent oxidoreductase [Hymenobacteraceae bacterium]
MTKNWFITGASTGFGKELAALCLREGDGVVATFRKPEQAAAFTQQANGRGHGVVADVTDEKQVQRAVQEGIAALGHLDVVVNNAGYGSLGAIEAIDDAEVRRQFDVNVFGPLRVLRAVLPHLRARRSGHILNITSIGGLQGMPAAGIYNGSKFALEGIGISLSRQLEPLGIHVTNIEPGPFRTEWAGASATHARAGAADYAHIDKNVDEIEGYSGTQVGDPVRAARAMFDVVRLAKPPLHLPLGAMAYRVARAKYAATLQEFDEFEYLGLPTDYPPEK